jgi:hypothetical protein
LKTWETDRLRKKALEKGSGVAERGDHEEMQSDFSTFREKR